MSSLSFCNNVIIIKKGMLWKRCTWFSSSEQQGALRFCVKKPLRVASRLTMGGAKRSEGGAYSLAFLWTLNLDRGGGLVMREWKYGMLAMARNFDYVLESQLWPAGGVWPSDDPPIGVRSSENVTS